MASNTPQGLTFNRSIGQVNTKSARGLNFPVGITVNKQQHPEQLLFKRLGPNASRELFRQQHLVQALTNALASANRGTGKPVEKETTSKKKLGGDEKNVKIINTDKGGGSFEPDDAPVVGPDVPQKQDEARPPNIDDYEKMKDYNSNPPNHNTIPEMTGENDDGGNGDDEWYNSEKFVIDLDKNDGGYPHHKDVLGGHNLDTANLGEVSAKHTPKENGIKQEKDITITKLQGLFHDAKRVNNDGKLKSVLLNPIQILSRYTKPEADIIIQKVPELADFEKRAEDYIHNHVGTEEDVVKAGNTANVALAAEIGSEIKEHANNMDPALLSSQKKALENMMSSVPFLKDIAYATYPLLLKGVGLSDEMVALIQFSELITGWATSPEEQKSSYEGQMIGLLGSIGFKKMVDYYFHDPGAQARRNDMATQAMGIVANVGLRGDEAAAALWQRLRRDYVFAAITNVGPLGIHDNQHRNRRRRGGIPTFTGTNQDANAMVIDGNGATPAAAPKPNPDPVGVSNQARTVGRTGAFRKAINDIRQQAERDAMAAEDTMGIRGFNNGFNNAFNALHSEQNILKRRIENRANQAFAGTGSDLGPSLNTIQKTARKARKKAKDYFNNYGFAKHPTRAKAKDYFNSFGDADGLGL